jgi:hypothetical protein
MKAQEKTFKYDSQVYPIYLHVVFSAEGNIRHESHAYLVEWVVNCINKALFNER